MPFEKAKCQVIIDITTTLLNVIEIKINNDAKQIGSECKIYVPLSVKYYNQGQTLTDNVNVAFKKEQFIQVNAWYEGKENQVVFTGYIKNISVGDKCEIECVDYIWKLGQKKIDFSWKKTTLKAVIDYLLEGTGISLMQPYVYFEMEKLYFQNKNLLFLSL